MDNLRLLKRGSTENKPSERQKNAKVGLEVVPAVFDDEADATTVSRALRSMPREALITAVNTTAQEYAELERRSSSLFKKLALLFCALKALDESSFQPWVIFRGVLSHGALSNASMAVPVAKAFLAGKILLGGDVPPPQRLILTWARQSC